VEASIPALVGVPGSSVSIEESCPMPISIGDGVGVLDLDPALVSNPAGFGSSMNHVVAESDAQCPVTHLQNNIKRPKVYTDGKRILKKLCLMSDGDNQ
jgi:hypothetical protein